MTETKQTYAEPVAGLMGLGDVRGEIAWRDYLALGFTAQHVPELCRMMLDEDLWWADSESDEVWSAMHAWRVLAQLRADSTIPCLIELLGRVDDYNDDWTSEELPVVFGHLGLAAVEPLRRFLADPDQGVWGRTAAAHSLVEIGQRHSALRAECVAALSRQLENFAQQADNFNAFLIGYLIDLRGVEAASVIEQAFAANKVDVLVQGDWEDVQIYLGLLAERLTPPPDNRALLAAQMGVDPVEMFDNLKRAVQGKMQRDTERKAAPQASTKAKAKAKSKRKQAKQSRKKQRKRK
jgi:hypothetical protein